MRVAVRVQGPRGLCDCWDEVSRVSAAIDSLTRDIGERSWKKAREETIPLLKDFMERLERCSGMKFRYTRGRLHEIEEKYMPRYDWASALGTAWGMQASLAYDAGCQSGG